MRPSDRTADFRDRVHEAAELEMGATGYAISVIFYTKQQSRNVARCTIRVDDTNSSVHATQVRYEGEQDVHAVHTAIRIACAEHARKVAG